MSLLLQCHEYCRFKLATEFFAIFTPILVRNYLFQFRMIYRIRKYTKSCTKSPNFATLCAPVPEILASEHVAKVQTCRECHNISVISTTYNHVRDSDIPNIPYIIGKVCSSSTTLSQKHCSISCPTCPYLQPKMRQFVGRTNFEDSYHHEDI